MSPAPEVIRPARADDFPRVGELLTLSTLPLDDVPASLAGYVVVEEDDTILAVGGMENCGRHCLLRSVAVSEHARNRGIARKLVERLIDDERARGTQSIYLLTTTAANYFSKIGFTEVNRESVPAGVRATRQFRDICPSSAKVMELDLRTT